MSPNVRRVFFDMLIPLSQDQMVTCSPLCLFCARMVFCHGLEHPYVGMGMGALSSVTLLQGYPGWALEVYECCWKDLTCVLEGAIPPLTSR